MRKIIFLILIFYSFTINAQIAYYDALLLNRNISKGTIPSNNDTVNSVLKIYFPNLIQAKNNDEIDSIINTNPFFINYEYGGSSKGIKEAKSISSLVSNISGLNVTSLADGFAKFIVKRTKQELNIAFFDKFKTEISKPEYKDLRTVFPQTYLALTIIGDEIYNYEAYIQTLRESFEYDLSNLPENLPGIIDNHPDFFAKFPELEATLKSGCYIASQLRDKVHPGDILAEYPAYYLDKLNPNWKGAIQTLQLFSASLRDSSKSDTTYWVNSEQIKKLYSDQITLKIYFGLLYQQTKFEYDSIHFQNTTLIDILKDVALNWDKLYPDYKIYIARLSEKANKLDRMIKNYKKPTNDSLAIELYSNYFKASIDLLEYSAEVGKLVPEKLFAKKYAFLTHLKDTLADYFDVTRSVSNLVLNINRRNYSAAIVNVTHIYDLTLNKYFSTNEEIKEAKSKVSEAGGDAAINAAYASRTMANIKLSPALQPFIDKLFYDYQLKEIKIKGDFYNKKTINKIFKYGSFMAATVQAKTSDEVEEVIESVALPAGSSRIKRESSFNVSLNAYCGFNFGHEEVKFSLKESPFINSYGITAPIGLSINWGSNRFLWMPGKRAGHFSHSIFLSAFDIGAIASFRFVDDTTKTLSKIELKDIISPGIFYSLGIAKTPLSINIGYQISPFLREVNISSNTFKTSYSRFSISLCVDIPLLNFYTKPK